MFTRKWSIVIHIVAIALALEVVFLVAQNRHLANSVETLTRSGSSSSMPSMPPTLEVGDRVPALNLVDLDGQARDLEAERGKRKLLFAFSSACPACQDSLAAWQSLRSDLEGAVEVVGISVDDAEDLVAYRDQQQLTYPILTGDPGELREGLELSMVPLTILLDSDRRVLGIWKGALDMSHLETITRAALNQTL